ncbi:Non-ribosomal peptide synthetase-like protein [Gammaproteobacteria bacterium]
MTLIPNPTAPFPYLVRGAHRPDLLREETLPDLLEATAQRLPDQTALVFGNRTLTYSELNRASDRAAHHLLVAGVQPGQFIGLWLPRGIDLLVMQLAITKAGAAWLPFDADTPIERVAVCLTDAEATGIVVADEWREQIVGLSVPIFSLRALESEPCGDWRRREGLLPTHPAYAIYTSGSTGKPKGIVISHHSICHFVRSENDVLGIVAQDRVYQGFSVAFDMSFEEIWIAWLVGATLWVSPRSLVTDPEALPAVLEDAGVTVLHVVPTLLAMFPRDVLSLRLINLGGEACPEALVERWATPHRQVFNTYGPTEATVSASAARLERGKPVTIGRPLPNYGLLVLGEDSLPLGSDAVGELCIIGPGVAHGYLGRPELTQAKFIANPWANAPHEARMYRTGDLASINQHGEVQCFGRVDDQVKIRGFRVELGEIEALLAQQPGITTAAVVMRQDGGVDQLVAFYLTDGATVVTAMVLRAALKAKLPPYMVPNRFESLTQMPRLASGKIDRRALGTIVLPSLIAATGDEPETIAEEILFAGLGQLFPGQPITRTADFFDDLGGHSLLAARLVSHLRQDARFSRITLGEVYRHRRIDRIAEALTALNPEVAPEGQVSDEVPPSSHTIPTWHRMACGLAQAATLPLLICLHISHWLAPFFMYHYLTGDPGDSIAWAATSSVLVFVVGQLLAFAVAIFGVRSVFGEVAPGHYPLWGVTYFRWWLSERLIDIAPAYLLAGCSLQTSFLRALGAKIDREVVIGSVTLRVPSLLTIDYGASLGNVVNLENARVEHGKLIIGRIHIGREASIGSYSVMEGNTSVAEFGKLDGLSALAEGQAIGAYEHWSGAPARKIGVVDPLQRPRRWPVTQLRRRLERIGYGLGALLVAVLFFMPIFPTFMVVDALDDRWLAGLDKDTSSLIVAFRYFLLAIPASAMLILLTALLSAAIRWLTLPNLLPGSWLVHSSLYYRKWLTNQIQECSMHILHGVYATVYAPLWYRLLGASVGKNAEISTAMGVVPDMLTLGDETFIADAVMLGDDEIDGGWMTVQPTVIGHRSFIGNGAYVPDGTVLPENVLIGVQSYTPETRKIHEGDTWVGSPPILLPARETLVGFPERLTFRPSWRRRLGRTLVETIRIVLPLAITIGVGYLIVLTTFDDAVNESGLVFAQDLAIDGLWYGVGTFLFVLALKWLLIGRYVPRAVPMWTPFVWLSEAVTNLYEAIAVPNFLDMLRGTPMLPPMLRLLGMRIGRGVYLDTTDFTEFDCVEIGDYAELNAWSGPQTHLFEDRIMKIGHVRIGAHSTIRARGIVLYDAEVGDGAVLGPLTLVLKGESIPPRTAWIGSPAQPGWR